MTPIEALDYAEQADKSFTYRAWVSAAYQRTEKFPKTPEDLFKKSGAGGSDILAQAKRMKAMQESDARLAKRKNVKPRIKLREG